MTRPADAYSARIYMRGSNASLQRFPKISGQTVVYLERSEIVADVPARNRV